MLNKNFIKQMFSLRNLDFQNRGGNYPASDIPDSITVGGDEEHVWVRFEFKNTDEQVALAWVKKYLVNEVKVKPEFPEYDVWQSGDYHGDWVTVEAAFE